MRRTRRPRSRVGFTVTVKIGKAVVRIRVRRRLREIYRLHEAELLPGTDMVVVARGRSVDAAYRKLEEDFLSCCRRLELLRIEGQA